MDDRDRRTIVGNEVQRMLRHVRNEPDHREQCRRRRAIGRERHRVGHHAPLRKAPKHDAILGHTNAIRQAIEPIVQ